MLLFGHAGITLGAATIIAGAVNYREKTPWLVSLSKYLDIRALLFGSMLPDIIDKPVGIIFFKDSISNGRIFAHSLLFLLILTIAGLILYKTRRQAWLLSLTAGVATHLLLDEIWQLPTTLFWPLLGFKFDTFELDGYWGWIIGQLLHSPYLLVTETIGLVVILWFGVIVVKKKQVINLLKKGRVLPGS